MLWSWKKQRCRDGVMSGYVSWCRHLLVPFFLTSLHPPSFHRNDFSTCSAHFSFWGEAPTKKRRARARRLTCARGQLPPFSRVTRTHVVQCLPVKSPTIYRSNLRREKNDRLVSVHTSIDCGEVWRKNQHRGLFW